MTFGRAVGEFVRQNVPSGYGAGIGIIDEAQASAALSFEDRALFDFTSAVSYAEQVEGMPSEELLTFWTGSHRGALHPACGLKKGREWPSYLGGGLPRSRHCAGGGLRDGCRAGRNDRRRRREGDI